MRIRLLLGVVGLLGASLSAQVTYDRILHADREPHNWLTYSGGYASQRYSLLSHITRDNVRNLALKWVWRPRYLDKMETTPLVVDGVLYAVQNSEVVALDAVTGRTFWTFRYPVPPESNAYLMVVKGLAVSGDRLFWATYDGHLIAIDAKTGKAIWNKTLFDYKKGLQLNVAPLVVKDKVILGPATNEFGTNCWLAAYDVHSGKEVWRFKTVPEPGEPGNETWPGESWQHGGAPIWVTGSYDPETNLTFWGTGNPNPGWNGGPRNPGDNLYSDSVIALDADTGQLKWHYQFTPNDEFDWDAVQVPVLADIEWQGAPRKVMLWANRNGFFYVLDRVTGKFLLAKAFVKQNWNVGFDDKGRPIKAPHAKPSPEGTYIEPGTQGGTNWYSPSFSPRTGLFYVSAWDNYSVISTYAEVPPWREGRKYTGRAPSRGRPGGSAGPSFRTEAEGYGAVRAIDPKTGEKKWDFKMVDYTESGVLTTASDVLFSGGREGNFFALDARNGELLWKVNLGGTVASGPITYAVENRQYVAVAADSALYVFGMPEAASSSRAEERPRLSVKLADDFEVTGTGDHASWRRAEWIALNRRSPAAHDYETRFKMLYSKTGLYFLMEGTDRKLTATMSEDFMDLWNEDVFEVFLWTDERHPVYFEYEISPLNRELPILIPNFDGRFLGWRPWRYDRDRVTRKATSTMGGPKQSHASIEGWRAEFFIPYTLLRPLQNVPPTPGTHWRANFYRMDHDGGKRTQWDWARVGESFHEYQKFGDLLFADR